MDVSLSDRFQPCIVNNALAFSRPIRNSGIIGQHFIELSSLFFVIIGWENLKGGELQLWDGLHA